MVNMNQEYRLGKRAFYILVTQKFIFGIVLLILALGISIVGKGYHLALISSFGIFVAGLLAIIIGFLIARLEYTRRTFTFDEFDMRLKKGIVTLTEVSIPYRQMQDINVERNLTHQFTGTSRVIIDSAGHEEKDEKNETDILLDPIDKDIAEDIREFLQRKIGVQVVKTEKQADTSLQ